MAVRIFDLSDHHSSAQLEVVEVAPRRRELRRTRQRYAIIGVLSLAIPFFAALIALGVAR